MKATRWCMFGIVALTLGFCLYEGSQGMFANGHIGPSALSNFGLGASGFITAGIACLGRSAFLYYRKHSVR